MAEPIRDPRKVQDQLSEFQSLQRNLQMFGVQRQQAQMQLEETKAAQEEVKGASGLIYKAVGNLLVQTTREEAKKDLSERIETLGVRSATMEKQEQKMRTRADELRAQLEKAAKENRPGE